MFSRTGFSLSCFKPVTIRLKPRQAEACPTEGCWLTRHRTAFSAYPPSRKKPMPLPETIPVRYTDEEAGYVTVRPIVRQTFRLDELLDMILSVTGKDAARVRQILHSGTIVYHFFRYTWTGFDADETELTAALAGFPDADPARAFAPDQCTVAIFESDGPNPRHLMELPRTEGSKRRMFRGQSFWERLLEIAGHGKVAYHGYSYGRRADLYRHDLNSESSEQITEATKRLAPRSLQSLVHVLSGTASVLFVCPRPGTTAPHHPRLSTADRGKEHFARNFIKSSF